MARLLAFCGSARKESFNQKTLNRLVAAARDRSADIETVDLAALDIPIYNADSEATSGGSPPGAVTLREKMLEAGGFIIASPEYNGFMTPLLLNAFDWSSRAEGKPNLEAYADKVVLIASASPGGGGGMRSAAHVRTLLSGIGCLVLPQTFAVPSAGDAFNEDGTFANERMETRAGQVVERLMEVADKLA